jgi:uncharacterized membrane protein YdfJ with MMPL/SSD domain
MVGTALCGHSGFFIAQGVIMKRFVGGCLLALSLNGALAATETGVGSGLGAGTTKFIERQEQNIHAMAQARTQEKSVGATRSLIKTQTKLIKQTREQMSAQDAMLLRTREQIKDHDKDAAIVKEQLQAQEKAQMQTLDQLKDQDKALGKTLELLQAQEKALIQLHDTLKAQRAVKPS